MNDKQLKPVERLKQIVSAQSVQDQIKNCLAENSGLFVASLIDVYSGDTYLQKCNPGDVVREALKAATLKLPINKSLGFAYIVPYKDQATFQIGYKGLIQLAMRTGQYKHINADMVYEGELKRSDKLTGEIDLSGEATSDKVVGYFAYIEMLNGFRKTAYWTTEKVTAHAKRFSASYNSNRSPWKTDFDQMALKTTLKSLLGKYGYLSVEMIGAIDGDERTAPEMARDEHDTRANSEIIDMDPETGEIIPPNVGSGNASKSCPQMDF